MGYRKSPDRESSLAKVVPPHASRLSGAAVGTPGEPDESASQAEKVYPDVAEGSEGVRPDVKTRFGKGNKAAVGRKPAMAKMGIPLELCSVDDPRYQKLLRNGRYYRQHRCKELSRMHGFLSAGASSLVDSASLALTGSRWMYILAAEATDRKESARYITLAAKLAGEARSLELSAWELSAREAAAAKVLDRDDKVPWLVDAKGGNDE